MPHFISMTQLSIHATSPSKQISIPRYSCCVITATSHLYHYLSCKTLCDARHIFPTIVSMSKSSVITSSPSKNFSFRRQYYSMSTPTSNLSDTHSSQGIHIGWFILITSVSQPQLSILSSSPCKHRQSLQIRSLSNLGSKSFAQRATWRAGLGFRRSSSAIGIIFTGHCGLCCVLLLPSSSLVLKLWGTSEKNQGMKESQCGVRRAKFRGQTCNSSRSFPLETVTNKLQASKLTIF
mmetsp:Transcript_20483/g.50235  ORF Transcript_20483/g.50235 Transcript_20483/m.50235 type:complete len:236 (+) Transcript_20483:1357-2064(+)